MNLKVYSAFVMFLLILSVSQLMVVTGQSEVMSISISIHGESQRLVTEKPVMVAGIWHYINITLSQTTTILSIVVYPGDTLPGSKNETNYYEWEYNSAAAIPWQDKQYDTYVQDTYCSQTNMLYSFYVGINQDASLGNWTLELMENTATIYTTTIFVEQKLFSVGVSQPPQDFGLQVDPFTETNISSEISDLFMSLENLGNIPIAVTVSYTQYGERVTWSNLDDILHPFNKTTNYVTVHTDAAWPAGRRTIEATVNLTGIYTILTGTVAFSEELKETITIPIVVGYGNYELYESPSSDITFQYEEQLTVDYDETKDIMTYIGGDGTVNVTVTVPENATLLQVSYNNQVISETMMPFLVRSTNTTEQLIITRVRFDQEDVTAQIIYQLDIDGDTQTFTTAVTVGAQLPPEEQPADTTFIMIIIGVCIVAVIGYMVYSQMRYRRR